MSDVLYLFLTVPVITAIIGWVTNWAAVKMIFGPKEFWGIGPLGWQGILYKKSHKFATNVATMSSENLISAKELLERVDPAEIEAILDDTLKQEAETLCRDAVSIVRPGAWDAMPAHVKTMVLSMVRAKTREIVHEIVRDLRERADELIDLHTFVYQELSGAKVDRLADFTRRIGHKEFRFIEYSGGVFGFLIGLLQLGVWGLMQTWWLMPIVGGIVGIVTNWLALQMIFRPQEPTRYLGLFTYQGLFAKRQAEISADYGQVSGEELLTPRNLLAFLAEHESGERLLAELTDTISRRMDAEWQTIRPMVPVEVSPAMMAEIKALVIKRLLQAAPAVQPVLEKHLAERFEVASTVEKRLASLPKPDFERVLRGIFEEDELTLILVGGFLGAAVGVGQGVLVLAG